MSDQDRFQLISNELKNSLKKESNGFLEASLYLLKKGKIYIKKHLLLLIKEVHIIYQINIFQLIAKLL